MSRAGSGVAALRRLALFSAILIGVDFVDELASGIPGVASPDIQSAFDVSYGMAAGWLLTAFGLLAVVVEPPIFLLADRHPRRYFVCGGLATLAGSCFLAAASPDYWILVLAVLLYGPASGAGVSLAQATLVDANPDDRERMLVRWTLSGTLGDLAAPLLLAGLAWLSLGWRTAMVLSGAAALVFALLLWRQPYPARSREVDEDEPSLRDALMLALKSRALRPWLVGLLLCDLLDELPIAFGALHLRDGLGVGVEVRALILACFTAGAVVGLAAADRLLARMPPLRLLVVLSAATALLYAGWLAATTPIASALLLFGVGVTAGGHYPIVKAQAYRALPERSGAVNAAVSLVGIAQLPVPILLGLVADTAGLIPCLTLLLAQPLGLIVLVLLQRGDGRAALR